MAAQQMPIYLSSDTVTGVRLINDNNVLRVVGFLDGITEQTSVFKVGDIIHSIQQDETLNPMTIEGGHTTVQMRNAINSLKNCKVMITRVPRARE